MLCLVPTGSVRLFTVVQIGRVVQLEESSGHKGQKVVERTLVSTILSCREMSIMIIINNNNDDDVY